MKSTGNHVADGEIEDSRSKCEECEMPNDRLHTFGGKEICLSCYASLTAIDYNNSTFYKGEASHMGNKYTTYIESVSSRYGMIKNRIIILDKEESHVYEYRVTSDQIEVDPSTDCYEYGNYKFWLSPLSTQDFIDAELKAQRLLDIIE